MMKKIPVNAKHAFEELKAQCLYHDITVKKLCKRAGQNRSSVYKWAHVNAEIGGYSLAVYLRLINALRGVK